MIPFLLFLLSFQQPILGPYSTAINIAGDIAGTPDSRPTTWGTTAAAGTVIQFKAPAGYRTRILRVTGDYIAFPRSGVVESGCYVEIGWGLKTTALDGSNNVIYPGFHETAYDNSFVWVQGQLSHTTDNIRIPIDFDTHVGGLLEADNIMISQMFVALNTTGLTIHGEPTVIITYQYERVP